MADTPEAVGHPPLLHQSGFLSSLMAVYLSAITTFKAVKLDDGPQVAAIITGAN